MRTFSMSETAAPLTKRLDHVATGLERSERRFELVAVEG
jgi:hypothetical protein